MRAALVGEVGRIPCWPDSWLQLVRDMLTSSSSTQLDAAISFVRWNDAVAPRLANEIEAVDASVMSEARQRDLSAVREALKAAAK